MHAKGVTPDSHRTTWRDREMMLRFRLRATEEISMWRKPKIVEIAVGLEINAYACAEIA